MGHFLVATSHGAARKKARITQPLEGTAAMTWDAPARPHVAIYAHATQVAFVAPTGGSGARKVLVNILASPNDWPPAGRRAGLSARV